MGAEENKTTACKAGPLSLTSYCEKIEMDRLQWHRRLRKGFQMGLSANDEIGLIYSFALNPARFPFHFFF